MLILLRTPSALTGVKVSSYVVISLLMIDV
jgi:hypothetical protein